MATVLELSAPYENHLLPVAHPGEGVCSTCRTVVVGGYRSCFQCNRHRGTLGATSDAVAFVALAVKGEQLARDLWVYKSNYTDAARQRPFYGLAALLWRWLSDHEACLAAASGVSEFAVVTTVPSRR